MVLKRCQPPRLPSNLIGISSLTMSATAPSNLPLPGRLELTGNLAKNWQIWRQVWDSYEILTKLSDQDSKFRKATFVTCTGPDAVEILEGLPFSKDEDQDDITKILELFEKHCIGESNVIYKRYLFNKRDQETGENIDTYANALRNLAKKCEYQALHEHQVVIRKETQREITQAYQAQKC